jgi:protein-S-isoprenylcysteine O-methyltransferase Ste14
MNPQSQDRPNIIVFPPLTLLATIALGALLQWRLPLEYLAIFDPTWRIAVGTLTVATGVLICVIGRRTLVCHGTNVNPMRPTTALVTDGIFGLTRNPLYVGGRIVMIGIGVIFALDWLLLLIVPSVVLLHFGVVMREEQYLERKFGAEYQSYKARVRRYVLPI